MAYRAFEALRGIKMNLAQWETIAYLQDSLKISANLDDTQNQALTLLIEMAYNSGKAEILNRGKA